MSMPIPPTARLPLPVNEAFPHTTYTQREYITRYITRVTGDAHTFKRLKAPARHARANRIAEAALQSLPVFVLFLPDLAGMLVLADLAQMQAHMLCRTKYCEHARRRQAFIHTHGWLA